MSTPRQQLIEALDRDAGRMTQFLSNFLAKPSPNPPGDTREATAFVAEFLKDEGVPYRIVAPQEDMPNILGTFEGDSAGRHLVLNGHIDVFPAGDEAEWRHPPWSGKVVDGRVWGRGATDMKAGTTASIMTYVYLYRLREHLKGKLTLTAVSDEETGGKWGTRYLLENHADEVKGDCVLNAEPSDPCALRFCEKGTLRLIFNIQTPGAHGAYVHRSKNANRIAGHLMDALDGLADIPPNMPGDVAKVLNRPDVLERIDQAMGAGTSGIINKVTVNYGTLRGGLKVNMLPGTCVMEVDIRLPIGTERATIMDRIEDILKRFPEATVEIQDAASNPPSCSDPNHEMVGLLQRVVTELGHPEPPPIASLGATDCKHFRYHGVPSYVYGVPPGNMSKADESVAISDFLHVVKTHALTAFDYLSA